MTKRCRKTPSKSKRKRKRNKTNKTIHNNQEDEQAKSTPSKDKMDKKKKEVKNMANIDDIDMEEDLNLDLLFEEPAVVADVEGEQLQWFQWSRQQMGLTNQILQPHLQLNTWNHLQLRNRNIRPLNNRDERNGFSRSRSREPS
ncbi:hypothetical protein OS493_008454 [Desmophyllum pertusum]|uniref:Uncharacterized protein n=1 Tax=Desmophyllum pertusum TaxID=174260 RepID=A0A9W9ZRT9_9CNID|nr:hypothetical protein OS493_008454 [Desmophyllum pertusum]